MLRGESLVGVFRAIVFFIAREGVSWDVFFHRRHVGGSRAT